MRIAILGSVALPVPPPAQGGTEWMAYFQAKGLSEKGHKVILFAAHGSKQENYELVEVGGGDTVVGSGAGPAARQPLNLLELPTTLRNFGAPRLASPARSENIESSRMLRKENVYLAQVIQALMDRKNEYDVILNNMRGEAVFLPIAKLLNKPFVNVMHLPMFWQLADVFKQYNTHVISISNVQRREFPDLNYLATVYNGVDVHKYVFNSEPNPSVILGTPTLRRETPESDSGHGQNDSYLLMMGTIGRHKNQAAAIRIAKQLGMKLVLAGKVRDADYFEELKKDIDGTQIIWKGELTFDEKLMLYQNAKAFIFPILWEEPFGLVMIEAMSCGTPVVAYGNGAIPEVVVDGVTGYVIESDTNNLPRRQAGKEQITNNSKIINSEIAQTGEEGLIEAIQKIDQIKREDCRKHVEEKFSVEKMVESYEKALKSLGV